MKIEHLVAMLQGLILLYIGGILVFCLLPMMSTNKKQVDQIQEKGSKNSMSLWYPCWCPIDVDDDGGTHGRLIAYLDDVLRFMAGFGIFVEVIPENAISVLDDCIKRYGKPLEILGDHGSQFHANLVKLKQPQ